MTGVLGLTFKTGELAADIAREIELYKRLRRTITDGRAMLLTQQARSIEAAVHVKVLTEWFGSRIRACARLETVTAGAPSRASRS